MFRSNLKELRKQKGLSQGDISKELYVVRKIVSKWENGLSSPSAGQLIRLSKLLDGLLGWLSGRNEAGVKALFDMVMLFPDRAGGYGKGFTMTRGGCFTRLKASAYLRDAILGSKKFGQLIMFAVATTMTKTMYSVSVSVMIWFPL